jgi:hypothetical protein
MFSQIYKHGYHARDLFILIWLGQYKIKTNSMKTLDVKMIKEKGSISLGFSDFLVEYITKTKRWDYVFDCLNSGKKIDTSNWDY